MFGKYFTILILPHKTSNVRKIKVPIRWFLFIICILIVGIIIWSWVLFDYFTILSFLKNTPNIQQRFSVQKKQIKDYQNQLKVIKNNLEYLKELRFKLRNLTNFEFSQPKNEEIVKEKYLAKVKLAQEKGIFSVIAFDNAKIKKDLHERKQKLNALKFFLDPNYCFYTKIPNQWPVKGLLVANFNYGSYTSLNQVQNQGIDIASHIFSPVYAPADGIVLEIKKDEFYGNLLVINHGMGLITRYGHLAKFKVKEAQIVHRGDIIANIGNTGKTIGSKLHYEVIFNGVPQNPINYIYDAE